MRKATAVACPNIALIKYWGNRDDALRLPANGSISMTLGGLRTATTVEWGGWPRHRVTVDGRVPEGAARERVGAHLERLRRFAGLRSRARVVSRNTFPASSGLASSASGFAALTAAALWAAGKRPTRRALSTLARLGSGSASRSVFGGFVEWLPGAAHGDSYAFPLAPPEWWDLVDLSVIVSQREKAVSSERGHRLASTSELHRARVEGTRRSLAEVRGAILRRDIRLLGKWAEHDALAMHAVMLTSSPPLLYWEPETVLLWREVARWREESIPVYMTLDAGPNPHLLVPREWAERVEERVRLAVGEVEIFSSGPGPGVAPSPDHLF
ncbi:MAG: diphosphomevalonate decarboxylase [Euryarchaeota archaeon]|nr:diphosphomevalonate decarboxylase [Euryarchaeota archaeon]